MQATRTAHRPSLVVVHLALARHVVPVRRPAFPTHMHAAHGASGGGLRDGFAVLYMPARFAIDEHLLFTFQAQDAAPLFGDAGDLVHG